MNKRYIDFVPGKPRTGSPRTGISAGVSVRDTTAKTSTPRHVTGDRTEMTRTRGVRNTDGIGARRITTGVRTTERTMTPKRVTAGIGAAPVEHKRSVATASRAASPTAVHSGATRGGVRAGTHARTRATAGVGVNAAPVLGVVEDLNTKFVNTDVPKRPLSQAPEPSPAVLEEEKAKKVSGRRGLKRAKANKLAENPVNGAENETGNDVAKTPSSPFINSAKVEKRPLSGKAYSKKTSSNSANIETKEEPKGTVAIIAKPEKESHVGIIVTIIITIILGAAAGTAAFLLLPK